MRIYLREMGSVELLSREGEIAIAKRIEAGRDAMIRGLCESPLTFEAIMVWRQELQESQILLRDIIRSRPVAASSGLSARSSPPHAPTSIRPEARLPEFQHPVFARTQAFMGVSSGQLNFRGGMKCVAHLVAKRASRFLELSIVLAIMAMLAVAAVPRYMEEINRTACELRLKTLKPSWTRPGPTGCPLKEPGQVAHPVSMPSLKR